MDTHRPNGKCKMSEEMKSDLDRVVNHALATEMKLAGYPQDESEFWWAVWVVGHRGAETVTADMASDAGDPSLEGMPYCKEEYEFELTLENFRPVASPNLVDLCAAPTVEEMVRWGQFRFVPGQAVPVGAESTVERLANACLEELKNMREIPGIRPERPAHVREM
jgi:hypothetical protein